MKYTFNLKICTILIVTFLLGYGNRVLGQEKINVSTGIGFPETMNIGVRLQMVQTQLGISVGAFPFDPGSDIFSISGDFYFHFAGLSELSDRRPWYGKLGLNFLREETGVAIFKYSYLNTRIGRDFNISKKIGVEIDAGAIFQLSYERVRKQPPSGWELDINFPVLPSMGINLFYRI